MWHLWLFRSDCLSHTDGVKSGQSSSVLNNSIELASLSISNESNKHRFLIMQHDTRSSHLPCPLPHIPVKHNFSFLSF